ncbi:MAG: hypothetical protein U1D32_00385 [Patescibacteria group bacterium]|nr:hypothetical protein [Patescibacteria group bacterium]
MSSKIPQSGWPVHIVRQLVPLMGGGRSATGKDRFPFWVHPTTGSDVRDGLSPGSALKTMQAAIDRCQDDVGDRIIRLPGTETVTSTVNFNKKGIIVQAVDIGYSILGRGERFTTRADAAFTDGPVATITRPCEQYGLGFWGREATGASVLADFSAGGFDSGGWSVMQHCWFPNHGEIERGLDLGSAAGGVDRFVVDNCVFDGTNNGNMNSGGKRLTEAVRLTQGHNCYVTNSEFANALTAINLVLNSPKSDPVHGNVGCVLQANRMLGIPATHFFLDVEDTAAVRPQTVLVADNWLGVALASESYKLNGSAQANLTSLVTAGLQFAGNHYLDS